MRKRFGAMEMGSNSVTESGGLSTNSPTESSLLAGGLKFGQKIYFEDANASSGSSSSGRRGKGFGSGQSGQPPRCQVEGCRLDLSNVKAYYSRHKVCCTHSKSPTVIVAGLQQRFCQQCSRFHQLPEFDQGKRSCRRRLAGHNERRRKPQSGSLLTSSRYGRLSSSIFGNYTTSGGSFLTGPWQTTRSSGSTTGSYTRRPVSTSSWQIDSGNPPQDIMSFSCPGIIPGVESYKGIPDSSCALSLLSNHTPRRPPAAPQQQHIWTSSILSSASIDPMNSEEVNVAHPRHSSTHHYRNWVYKDGDDNNAGGTNSPSPVLGLGRISETGNGRAASGFPGFQHHQESRRQYCEPDNYGAYDSSSAHHGNWSL